MLGTADSTDLISVSTGRSVKAAEKKQAAQVAADQKQALAAEADAFRGVHLAPNAHHWDEVSLYCLISPVPGRSHLDRTKVMTAIFWTRSSNSKMGDSTRFLRLRMSQKRGHRRALLMLAKLTVGRNGL